MTVLCYPISAPINESTMTKTALITGIICHDGVYLAEFLLNKGYIVHGIKRRSCSFNTEHIDDLYRNPHGGIVNFFMHYGNLTRPTTSPPRYMYRIWKGLKANFRIW